VPDPLANQNLGYYFDQACQYKNGKTYMTKEELAECFRLFHVKITPEMLDQLVRKANDGKVPGTKDQITKDQFLNLFEKIKSDARKN
jgi:Ca2+-binding EF-hand superfamily protein